MNKEALKQYNNLYEANERKDLIASMLAEFRKANNLQQKEIAELIGIKAQTYCAYESGRNEPPAEILVRLSWIYEIPVDVLIQRDNISKAEQSPQDILDRYDSQIKELRQELLKGDPEATKMFTSLLDGIQTLSDTIRKANTTDDKKD